MPICIGRLPGHEKLHDVVDGCDAADAQQRTARRRRTWYTARRAMGLTAGPLRPPRHAAQHRPATPPIDRHAQAGVHQRDGVGPARLGGAGNRRDVGDVGRELGQNRQTAGVRTPETTASTYAAAVPKSTPPLTLGQEMFNSRASAPGRPSSRAAILDELLAGLAGNAHDDLRAQGPPGRATARAMNRPMPSLSRPMELSMPAAVSTVRGGGLPARGLLVIVLGRMAPRRSNSSKSGHLPCIAERARGHRDRVGQAEPSKLHVELNVGGIHAPSQRTGGRLNHQCSGFYAWHVNLAR